MGDKQRRDYGSGSISQRKDGTWTARMIIGTNEAGNECFRTGMIKRTVTGNPALGVAVPAKKTFVKRQEVLYKR